jgi:hypothetical protein
MRPRVVVEICFALRSPYPTGDGSAVIFPSMEMICRLNADLRATALPARTVAHHLPTEIWSRILRHLPDSAFLRYRIYSNEAAGAGYSATLSENTER